MTNNYDEYLSQLHAKKTTDETTVQNVVYEATGIAPQALSRIIAGEQSEVYEAALTNGKSVIIRITNTADQDFQGEAWALQQVQKFHVPVAPVLLLKSIDQKTFCVQTKLPGEPLERGGSYNFWEMDDKEIHPLVIQAGEILARIHLVHTMNYGTINGKGQGEYRDWHDFLDENKKERKAFFELADKEGFDKEVLEEVFHFLDKETPHFHAPQPVLNHDDFGPKHFMIQENHITGILDFGDATSHSYVNDFARWEYWFGAKAPHEWLIEGYTKSCPLQQHFKEQLRIISAINGLSVLWYYADTGYKQGATEAVKKLQQYI